MKHLLLTLLCSLFVTCAKSQSIDLSKLILVDIGEFKAQGGMHKAQAYIDQDSTIILYRLEPSWISPNNGYEYKPIILMLCTISLNEKLQAVKDKFAEWSAEAKQNNVERYDKMIDVDIPFIYLEVSKKSKGQEIREFVKIPEHAQFMFIVPKLNAANISFRAQDNRSFLLMKYSAFLAFYGVEEFDDFCEFINYENVKQRLKNRNTHNNLFQ